MVKDELLHLFEELKSATIDSLHWHEELADLILEQTISLLEPVNHLCLHFGLRLEDLRLVIAIEGQVSKSIKLAHLGFELAEALTVFPEHLTILFNQLIWLHCLVDNNSSNSVEGRVDLILMLNHFQVVVRLTVGLV